MEQRFILAKGGTQEELLRLLVKTAKMVAVQKRLDKPGYVCAIIQVASQYAGAQADVLEEIGMCGPVFFTRSGCWGEMQEICNRRAVIV